jgi:hypothetical protein
MPKVADHLLMFVPETWGEVDRFLNFYEQTYAFQPRDKRAVAGVRGHFMKADRLIELAGKLRPNLAIDNTELEEKGFTPAVNAEEIVTVVEAAILEMYSTIDCTVKVLRAVYASKSRGFKDSTRKFFQSAAKIEGEFPDKLQELVASATWYWRLLTLRDELTHLATGHLHTDHKTGLVHYDHFGLKEGDKPLSIEDVFGWLSTTLAQVNAFTGSVFHHLNRTLADKEMFQACGMVQGRMLWRYVSPANGPLTFNSGRCGAWTWFEKPELPTCPFVGFCGAYQRKAPAPPGDAPSVLESSPSAGRSKT